jgi:NodT family efflux transporter outer membrane factor (OMF) lipoprotein
MSRIVLPALVGTILVLGGCTVGPDFHSPVSPPPSSSFVRPSEMSGSGKPTDAVVPDKWWVLFGDPVLSSLEERVASANLDVKIASTRLLQSRAQRRVVGADQYPSLTSYAAYRRERSNPDGPDAPPPAAGSSAFDVFKADFDASWELDLWGRIRRSVEAADARFDASAESRRFALLSVEAELANDYAALRGAQTLLGILDENLTIAQSSVKLTRSRFLNGVTTNLDVANAEAQVASIEASIPSIEAERDELINALGLLLALPPRALQAELGHDQAVPGPPGEIPVGFPSALLRRRPDVRRAEADLHAATAEIGVAKADFYPRISLSGGLGGESLQLSDLGGWSSRQLSVGPVLTLPLFEGGRLSGTLELRTAEQQEAALQFQEIVLQAWREVDDAMTDYAGEQRRHGSLEQAAHQNEVALAIAQRRYREGAIDFLNVLSVQKALLDARSETARGSVFLCQDVIKLYKALGGGWEARFPKQTDQSGEAVQVADQTR